MLPPGLRYVEALVGPEEEAQLVRHITQLELRPFEFHGYQGLRRTHWFGYRYDYTHAEVQRAEPLPEFLLPLRRQVALFAGCAPEQFAQALVTEYRRGAPIGWHRDKPQFGTVVGVSLLSACVLRLRYRRPDRKWDRRALPLQPRSAYLLSGESRTRWEHSIAPMADLRYSVTFRTLASQCPSAAVPP